MMKTIKLAALVIATAYIFTPTKTLRSAEERGIECYAKAGLGIYDTHGQHRGYGETLHEARQNAMADCRAQHPFVGCVLLWGSCG